MPVAPAEGGGRFGGRWCGADCSGRRHQMTGQGAAVPEERRGDGRSERSRIGNGRFSGKAGAVTLWFLQVGPSTSSAFLHTLGKSMPTSRRRIPTRLHRLPHCQAVSAWISAVIAWAAAVSLARPAGTLLRSRARCPGPRASRRPRNGVPHLRVVPVARAGARGSLGASVSSRQRARWPGGTPGRADVPDAGDHRGMSGDGPLPSSGEWGGRRRSASAADDAVPPAWISGSSGQWRRARP